MADYGIDQGQNKNHWIPVLPNEHTLLRLININLANRVGITVKITVPKTVIKTLLIIRVQTQPVKDYDDDESKANTPDNQIYWGW